MISNAYRVFRKIITAVVVAAVFVISTGPGTARAEETALEILSKTVLVGSAVNILLEETMRSAKGSAATNAKAMDALRKWVIYEIPLDERLAPMFPVEELLDVERKVAEVRNSHISDFKKYNLMLERVGTIAQGLNIISLGTDTYDFVKNFRQAIDNGGNVYDRWEGGLSATQNVYDAYLASTEIASTIAENAPGSVVAKFWGNNTFAKGLSGITKGSLYSGLSAVTVGAQLESWVYTKARDSKMKEIGDNTLYAHKNSVNARSFLISRLAKLAREKAQLGQRVGLSDLTQIADSYLVLHPTYSGDPSKPYVLSQIIMNLSNNTTYLGNTHNSGSFSGLSNYRRIMVALDALAIMAALEDAETQSYLYKTVADGAKPADIIFGGLEGNSMYDIYDTESLLNKMFVYWGTSTSATEFYNHLFRLAYNSEIAAGMQYSTTQIGKTVSSWKASADASGTDGPYLEIKLSQTTRVAAGWDADDHTFHAMAGETVYLAPRNGLSMGTVPALPVLELFAFIDGASVATRIAATWDSANTRFQLTIPATGRYHISALYGKNSASDPGYVGSVQFGPSGQFLLGADVATSGEMIGGEAGAVVLDDQFDGPSLNTSVWAAAGYSVSQHDGYLDLEADQTDNVGYASTTFAPLKRIRVELRHLMHTQQNYGGIYAFPSIGFNGESDSTGFGVTWMQSGWEPDYCNNGQYYNKVQIANTGASSCNSDYTSLNSSDYFDRWITSVIEYDYQSGLITLDLDGDGIVDASATQAPNLRVPIQRIRLSPYGWWTGHYHKIDYIRITGDYAEVAPRTARFIAENLPDGTFVSDQVTKNWRFQSGPYPLYGLKAVQVSGKTDNGLGIDVSEIPLGDVPANSNFIVLLPVNPSHDGAARKKSYWKLVASYGKEQQVLIDNSVNNDFWLDLRTNRPPAFSQLQLDSVSGKTGAVLELPMLASDPDGDSLSYSVISGGGSVLNGVYTNTFSSPGIHPVVIEASDGHGGSASRTIQAVVTSNGAIGRFYEDTPYPYSVPAQSCSGDTPSVFTPVLDQYKAIHYLTLKGVTIGRPFNSADPGDTRRNFEGCRAANQAEALAMLMKSANLQGLVNLDAEPRVLNNLVANGENYSWAAGYALKAEDLGLIPAAETFDPSAPATRGWVASLLAGLLKLAPPLDAIRQEEYVFADAADFATSEEYEDARATAFFGYLVGKLGNSVWFHPNDPMYRVDLAYVGAKVLQAPRLDGFTTSGLSEHMVSSLAVPGLSDGGTFSVTGLTGLKSPRLLVEENPPGSGVMLLSEDTSAPGSHVTVSVVRKGIDVVAANVPAESLAAAPVVVPTTPPAITSTESRSVLVLVEDSLTGARALSSMEYYVVFPDADGDGVRDDVDRWPNDSRFSADVNSNGIPDNMDSKWGLSARKGSDVVTINGVSMTLSEAVLNGAIEESAPIVGGCGTAGGQRTAIAPAANLCGSGVASAVTSSGAWSWTCFGIAAPDATCTAAANMRLDVTLNDIDGGTGSVNSVPSGVACTSGTCTGFFDSGSTIVLIAAPDKDSVFSGWTGPCVAASGNCSVTMSGDRGVTASFSYVLPARANAGTLRYFSRLQDAYDAVSSGGTIEARDYLFTENLFLGRSIPVLLEAGYDTGYVKGSGFATLHGTVVVRSGTLRVRNFKIR